MSPLPDFTDLILRSEGILILGVGGGGDAIASIPLANFALKLGDKRLFIGSAACTWPSEDEYSTAEPNALRIVLGPHIYDVRDLNESKLVCETIALVNEKTNLDGLKPAEAVLAGVLPGTPFVAGLTHGAAGLRRDLEKVIKLWKIDLVVAIDVGSDSWHNGSEVLGAKSAMVDFIVLSALYEMQTPVVYALAGYGLDGEMLPHEIDARIAKVMAAGGYLGGLGLTQTDVLDIVHACTLFNDPIISRIPFAAQGMHGWHRVNTYSPWGTPVYIGTLAANILFFDLNALCNINSKSVLALRSSASIAGAENAFRSSTKQIPETALKHYVDFGHGGSALAPQDDPSQLALTEINAASPG